MIRLRPLLKLCILLIAFSIPAATAWWYYQDQQGEDQHWLKEQVTRGNIEISVAGTGTLEPSNYVDVGAQVSGQIEKLYVKEGDEVKLKILRIEPERRRLGLSLKQAEEELL